MNANEIPNSDENARPAPLMIEDVRLDRAYSAIDVALIAANCGGETAEEKIYSALDLLVAFQDIARIDQFFRDALRKFKGGDSQAIWSETIEAARQTAERQKARHKHAKKCCAVAKRHKTTGQILRSSLVIEVCKISPIKNVSADHATRLFNNFVNSERDKLHQLIPHGIEMGKEDQEIHDRSGSRAIKDQFESRSHPVVILNDAKAEWLAEHFLQWLEEEHPKTARPKPMRSRNDESKGQFVSPKTRGADRATGSEDGKSKTGKVRKPEQFKPRGG
ncbi:hypothetical protein HQ447_20040 [bacterium]|nr:hypothetical protein [bacterium]